MLALSFCLSAPRPAARPKKIKFIFFAYKSPTTLRSCIAEGPPGLRRLAAPIDQISALLCDYTLLTDKTPSIFEILAITDFKCSMFLIKIDI